MRIFPCPTPPFRAADELLCQASPTERSLRQSISRGLTISATAPSSFSAQRSGWLATRATPASTGTRMLSGRRRVLGRRKPGYDRCKKQSNPGTMMSNYLGISFWAVPVHAGAARGSRRLCMRTTHALPLRPWRATRVIICSPRLAGSATLMSNASVGSALGEQIKRSGVYHRRLTDRAS